MSGPPYRPLDAQVIPRFAGIRTYMRAPHVTELAGVGQINDSGVRILHSARALRKVAVGK